MSVPSPYVYPARLVRVIDGDTQVLEVDLGFEINMQITVRLNGVNTPEISGPKAKTEYAEGMRARGMAVDWFAAAVAKAPPGAAWPLIYGSEKYDEREKYGRSLGSIYALDGDSLNAMLIAAGWPAPASF